MRILIVSDAWHPQINGVVRTLVNLAEELKSLAIDTHFLTPNLFRTIPLPGYKEIRLALPTKRRVGKEIQKIDPDFIHIATEGPLGFVARKVCMLRGLPFTTSYHTRFPEYVESRYPFPKWLLYAWFRRFHNAGRGVLVATPSMREELETRGFRNVRLWSRGVDTELFHPERRRPSSFAPPIFLYVGRIAVEKNLPAFLDLDLPGTKVVVGEGPDLKPLMSRYPEVQFLGIHISRDLAEIYASADVFVFPSKTDTFGNVLLEALASGCPVAAYPVTGPLDILKDGRGGVVAESLADAALAALTIPRSDAREKALRYTWANSAQQFLSYLQPVRQHIGTQIPSPASPEPGQASSP